MSNNAQLSARMKVLYEKLNKSGNLLGKEAGLGNATVDGWSDKQIEKPTLAVESFLNHHKINREWWKTGQGEVFITPVEKTSDNKEKDSEEVYRNIVEGNTEYVLIPRSVIQEKYRLVSLEQLEKDRLQMENDKKIIDRLLDIQDDLHSRFGLREPVRSQKVK